MYDRFQSASAGNVQDTRKFATQLVAVAIPTAAARTRLGNISEINTQTTGPQDKAKKNTNAFAPIRAIVALAPVSVATSQPAAVAKYLELEADDFGGFARTAPRVAREHDIRIFELTPTDESLESIFGYLVSR